MFLTVFWAAAYFGMGLIIAGYEYHDEKTGMTVQGVDGTRFWKNTVIWPYIFYLVMR